MPRSQASAVKTQWNRIQGWLADRPDAERLLRTLNGPATDAQVASAEKRLGFKLPEELKALYRIFDGQDEDRVGTNGYEPGVIPSGDEGNSMPFIIVPLKDLARDYPKSAQDAMSGWIVGWLPFATDGGGDQVVLDLASPRKPKRGRVLQFNHELGGAMPIAASLTELLASIADGLLSGDVLVDTSDGQFQLVRRQRLDFEEAVSRAELETSDPPEANAPAVPTHSPAVAQSFPSPDERRLAEDRAFYDLLGEERTEPRCRTAGCTRGAIKTSAWCRPHHFEMVKGRPCPFNE